jgi:hypothetical protein
MQIIKVIFTNLSNWSRFSHFIEGIKEEVRSLRPLRVVHMKRKVNSATHTVAKAAPLNLKSLFGRKKPPFSLILFVGSLLLYLLTLWGFFMIINGK